MNNKSTLLELCEYFGEHPDDLATLKKLRVSFDL